MYEVYVDNSVGCATGGYLFRERYVPEERDDAVRRACAGRAVRTLNMAGGFAAAPLGFGVSSLTQQLGLCLYFDPRA